MSETSPEIDRPADEDAEPEPDLGNIGWSRRRFLQAASFAGAALAAACQRTPAPVNGEAGQGTEEALGGAINSNSRADTALDLAPVEGSGTPAVDVATIVYRRRDPMLAAATAARTQQLNWRASEIPIRIREDTVISSWTFEGDVPGPVVRCRVGDTVEFTLTNEGQLPHSMDFHAAQIDPKVAFRSVPQGESVSFTFRPRYAGAYVYHCGTGPVLMHIGAGMYGAIIVDPEEALPPAREIVLVQSEYYVGSPSGGISPLDYQQMATTSPDFVVFNGRPDQYIREPIRVSVGDRVRFYVVAAGPSHPCNFHIVGEQFDRVWMGAPPSGEVRGVQTCSVPPGGGMIFEFVAEEPGEYPFVNHGFGHGQKGAIGFLVVE